MAEHEIFTSTNPYWSKQTQGGTKRLRRFGWCAAASAIWCSNILAKGKKVGDSEPDIFLAGILQVKYRWDPNGGGQDYLNLLDNVGLKGVYKDGMYRDGVLQHMGSQPGVYHFSSDEHSMAMDTRVGHYSWYDIERGLYTYDSLDELKNAVKKDYESEGRVWRAILCSI